MSDVGNTLGDAGYSTVAGLGKTGYNLGSGLTGAVTGGGKKAEGEAKKAEGKPVEGEAKKVEGEAKKAAGDVKEKTGAKKA